MTIATHPDYLALLRGVLLSPNDDLPRLVLADWLEEPERAGSVRCEDCDGEPVCEMCDGNNTVEHYSGSGGGLNCPNGYKDDDKPSYFVGCKPKCLTCNSTGYVSSGNAERAELIRGMCWMTANHTDCPTRMTDYARSRPVPMRCGACEYCTTRRRCEKIYSKVQWLNGMNYAVCFDPTALDGMMPTGPGITIGVSRGFVGSIRLTAEQFMQHAAELFREHPITEVVLSNVHIQAFLRVCPNSHRVVGAAIIPDAIYWEMTGYSSTSIYRTWRDYPTHEAALAALSRACVRYGRILAELPEEYAQ